jgi:hypothetical protein
MPAQTITPAAMDDFLHSRGAQRWQRHYECESPREESAKTR